MPKAQRHERQAALRQLEPLTVSVRTLPAIEDLAAGRVTVSDLRPVEAEDLLGRDPVPPNAALLARNIAGKSVLVTGAGGSIGSELVRQILRQGPRRLVLLDAGEGQLYEIEREVAGAVAGEADSVVPASAALPEIVTVLGSILNARSCAAPLEKQRASRPSTTPPPTSTCRSSSTMRSRACATTPSAPRSWRRRPKACGVERFVLVSTDKAVRPTSIMGASKRLAEMVLQARAANGNGAHRLHDGALRQCARQLGLGRAQVSPADRGRWAGDGHAPRRDPLFHVDPARRRRS